MRGVGADIALGEEPDFGHQAPMPAIDGRRDADGHDSRPSSAARGADSASACGASAAGRHEGLAERARRGACGQRRMFARPSARRRSARLQTRRAEKDREIRRDPHRIGQTQPMQHAAKQSRLSPNSASASTPVTVNPLARTCRSKRQRLAPFFLKPYRGGNPCPTRAPASVTQAVGKYSAAPSR